MVDSAFDRKSFFQQTFAHALAKIALELDGAVDDCAAGAACPLQFLTQVLQKGRVLREAVHDGDRLPATTLLLHAQLGDDPDRNRFAGGGLPTARAVARRPAAAGADAPGVRGINETSPPAISPASHERDHARGAMEAASKEVSVLTQ